MSGVPGTNEADSGKNGITDPENDSSGNSEDVNSFSSISDTKGSVEELEYDLKEDLRTLAELICSHEEVLPKRVEDTEYLQRIYTFNPLFKASFSEAESECLKVYEERRVITKKFLGTFDGQISLSVDILRYENYYDNRQGDYLCLCAHFIDENWELKRWILHFCSLSVSGPSDDSLHKYDDWGIFRLLEDWGIENKISTLTMNNDNFYLVEYVKRHIQEKKELQLNGQLFPVYCCADIISVMVQDAFNAVDVIIQKVRQVHTFKTDYPLWYLKLKNLQEASKLWSMGKLSSKDVIDSHDQPSPEEWKKVEGVCKIAQSIFEVSNALFYTEHLTSSVYLYHLHELRSILTKMSMGSDGFNRTIVEGMLKKFDKYCDDMFLLLAISAALDPRFKMKYIEFFCSKVTGKEANSQVAAVLGAIRKLFDEYVIRFPEKENFTTDSDSQRKSCPPTHANYTFSVLQDYQQFIHLNGHPTEKSDLDFYLERPVLPWSGDFNALDWWRRASAEYPTLSRMAHDFLAIPVSRFTKTEAFYTAPIPAEEHVVCLNPEFMNALMCTRSWVNREELIEC